MTTGALSLFGDAAPMDPAADACPACSGPTTRRGRECLPCLAAGVTAARLDLGGADEARVPVRPTVNNLGPGGPDTAPPLTPHALATWPHGPTR